MIYQDERTGEWVIFSDGLKSRYSNYRSMKMADKFSGTLTSIQSGARAMFDAQQVQCFANIQLMKSRKEITISMSKDGLFVITVNKTDEELNRLGYKRDELERGLTKLFRVISSVSEEDSTDIATFMD